MKLEDFQYRELKFGQLKIHCNRFLLKPKENNLILNSN